MIPRGEKAGCNLEWFLSQQKNTRQPSRSGASRMIKTTATDCDDFNNFASTTRNLLMSSQAMKRSLLHSRQRTSYNSAKQSSSGFYRSNDNLKLSHSDFNGLLTATRTQFPRSVRGSTMTNDRRSFGGLKAKKKGDEVELTQTQVVRKIHSDLQEHAIQLLEERENEKIGTKIKFAISNIKQSQQLQNLAIKFWILIVNLQYFDVQKLSQNYQERQYGVGSASNAFTVAGTVSEDGSAQPSEFPIQHTQLPVDLGIYERVTPLFMKALGSLGDPDFSPLALPQSQEKYNAIIKKHQKQMLLNGQVFFEKFVTDLGLMLGKNLLSLNNADVAYIYRRCLLAMSQRFNDDLHLIQIAQIKSPFDRSAILQAQRNIVGATPTPVIIESSLHSDRDGSKPRTASRVQIIQSNEERNSSMSNASASLQNKRLKKEKTGPVPLSAKNLLGTDHLSQRRPSQKRQSERQHSFSNFAKQVQMQENPEQLPLPPHMVDPDQLSDNHLQNNNLLQTGSQGGRLIQRNRTGSMYGGRKRSEIQYDIDSRNSRSSQRSRIQQIEVGIPKEKVLLDEDEDFFGIEKKSQDTNIKESSSEDGRVTQQNAEVQTYNQPQQKQSKAPLKIPIVAEEAPLFDFDKLTAKRQDFKDELAAKIAYTKARTAAMVPFETPYPRKSCLEVLDLAKEYLVDECMRVKKTPAGFNRPTNKTESNKRIYFQNKEMIELRGSSPTAMSPLNALARLGTKHLDSRSNNEVGMVDDKSTTPKGLHELRDTANVTQELNVTVNITSDQSQKLPQPIPIAKRHVNPMGTCDSADSSVISSKPPVVHVTKYGMRIPAHMALDPGYVIHRLQEEAEQASASGQDISEKQQALEMEHRKFMMMQSLPTACLEAMHKQARLEMKTKRLLQEKMLDGIFRNSNISKVVKKTNEKDSDEKQFIQVISKLNQDNLMSRPSQHYQQAARGQDVFKDISFQEILQQRSQEEGDLTHHTTSNDDSQFMTQDPVTHPKFNQVGATDSPENIMNQVSAEDRYTDQKQLSSPFGTKKSPSFKGVVGGANGPSGKQGGNLTVRRRVFGFQHVKNLSVVSPTHSQQSPNKVLQQDLSPIHVQRVQKTDIDEMEGKQVQPQKVSQKAGPDETNRSLVHHAVNVDKLQEPRNIISSNTLLNFGTTFDKDRKSQVTAHLASGTNEESWKAFSSPGNQLSESATQSYFRRQNSDYVEKLSQREAVVNFRASNKSVKAPNFAKNGQDLHPCSSDLDQVMTYQDKQYGSTKEINYRKKKNSSSYSRPTKKSVQHLGNKLVNINVSPGDRSSSQQISVISVNQIKKARGQTRGSSNAASSSYISYDDKVKMLVKKQDKLFPFGDDPGPKTKKRNNTKDGKDETAAAKKVQDSLFALRRANKCRREQLQRATFEKKERICNSKIPGVDYSRQVRQFKASFGQIYDSQGNLLQAISDPQTGQMLSGNNGTLLIPEELMQKMQQEGFMVFSPEKSNKINDDILGSYMKHQETLNAASNHNRSKNSEMTGLDQKDYSEIIAASARSVKKLEGIMAPMREIVVRNNNSSKMSGFDQQQKSQRPIQMIIRSEQNSNRSPIKSEDATTQMLEIVERGSPLPHRLTADFKDEQIIPFSKLNLENVGGVPHVKDEDESHQSLVLKKAKSVALQQNSSNSNSQRDGQQSEHAGATFAVRQQNETSDQTDHEHESLQTIPQMKQASP